MKLPITPISIMNFFFMLGVSIILAVQQNLFESGTTEFYPFLSAIMPQEGYAATAFITAVVLFTAFILRKPYIEIVGLFLSGIFSLFILCGYLTSFPNIASVTYAVWTMASFMTIVMVLNEIQDEKERNAK